MNFLYKATSNDFNTIFETLNNKFHFSYFFLLDSRKLSNPENQIKELNIHILNLIDQLFTRCTSDFKLFKV